MNQAVTNRDETGADKKPIREGDRFRSSCGTEWTVFDIIPVQGCWVHSADRRYQTMFKHRELRTMERL